MFRWKRSTLEADPPASQPESPRTADAAGFRDADDPALEAFVSVLRAMGQYAFDLEHESSISYSQLCEAWARHLLILAPPPLSDDELIERERNVGPQGEGEDASAETPPRRDWPTVVQFMQSRRQREQQHVNKALGDLRQGIWAFAQSLGSALIEDQRMDNRLKSQIDRLKSAVERNSTEELKKEMVSAASNLSKLVSERQQVQRLRLEQLGARVTDLAGQLRDAKAENTRDGLTQLVNRKGFDEFMNRMVFMRDVFGESAALLVIDADRFKSVNDTYGHPGGDAVLKSIADTLVRNFPRKSDLVARYGGEEFAVVLPDTSLQNAVRLAERTRQAVAGLEVPYGDQIIRVTISIGVGRLGRFESVQAWLERTDQALYMAKAHGRDKVVDAIDPD
ncbi:MAG: GGDEF domain-containing protein [Chloroflexi bacterium]|nr:GGDEF domain-containing protein [Chloroflexota bacterium]